MDKLTVLPRISLILLLSSLLIGPSCSNGPTRVAPTPTIIMSPMLLATLPLTATLIPTSIPSITLSPTFTRVPATLTPMPSPEIVTSSPTPLIMPPLTGRIVYRSCFPQKLAISNLDGSGGRILIDKDLNPDKSDQRGLEYEYPSWSPDGRWIVFSSTYAFTGEQIFVIKANGSQVKQLTRYWGKHIESPAWSPDGQKIAFVIDAKIFVMNSDGSEVVPLTNTSLVEYLPAWSPDGHKIAFFSQKSPGTKPEILFVVNADGTDRQLVTDFGAGTWDTGGDRIAWSPDGKRIAFIGGSSNTLYTVEPDGRNLTQVSNSDWEVGNPSWSPDGKWIAVNAKSTGMGWKST